MTTMIIPRLARVDVAGLQVTITFSDEGELADFLDALHPSQLAAPTANPFDRDVSPLARDEIKATLDGVCRLIGVAPAPIAITLEEAQSLARQKIARIEMSS